jgi:hypothetical protein
MGDDELSVARRHVMRGRQLVADQLRRVFEREKNGLDATRERATLHAFEGTLSMFEDQLEWMLKKRGRAIRDQFPQTHPTQESLE